MDPLNTDFELLTEEKGIQWFLDTVVVDDIRKIIEAGPAYLAVSLIAQSIELLGALFDEKEFGDTGLRETRFALAIDTLFTPINIDYHRYNKTDSEYYLYKNLRCGMAHILRPHTTLQFMGKSSARRLGLKHLSLPDTEDSKQLVIVVEDFHSDLATACESAKRKITRKTHSKLKQGYLVLKHFVPAITTLTAPSTLPSVDDEQFPCSSTAPTTFVPCPAEVRIPHKH